MSCCSDRRRGLAGAWQTIARGSRGLSRAVTLQDLPEPAVLAERVRACFGEAGRTAACDRLAWGLTCRACGCLAIAKIRLASEQCPLGKWGPVAAAASRGRSTWRPPSGPPTPLRPPDA